MTYLILMLAVAIALFREPLGRSLAQAVGAIDWKWVVILALLGFAVWGLVQHVQAPMSFTGDAVAGLFDTFTYGDILIGVAVAFFNRRTQLLISRVADLARLTAHLVVRRASRAARLPARRRRRPPDRDDPEPEGFRGILALA